MPQVEVSSSMIVREQQKDAEPAGNLSVEFKDNTVQDYSAPMRLQIEKGSTRKVDVSHYGPNKMIFIKRVSGPAFSLSLRKGATASSIVSIGRFFSAELLNCDQVAVANETGPDPVILQIQIAAIKES